MKIRVKYVSLTVILLCASLIFTSCNLIKSSRPQTTPNEETTQKFTDRFSIQVGSKEITLNQNKLELNAPVVEIDGHSYLPLRFFLDYFGAEEVNYNERTEEISFILSRYSELNPEILQKYATSANTTPEKTPANKNSAETTNEEYESYKLLYIQSMTESYKGMAKIGFNDAKKAFTITPENELLGVIMLAIDGNPGKVESWTELVKSIMILSNSIKTTLPEHSVMIINPTNTNDMFLLVKDGNVIYDVLKDK